MERQNYFKKLYILLRLKFSSKEAKEIIRDQQEYFDIALTEGECAKNIIKRLGSPQFYFKEITKKMQKKL